jgi:hypothetical protein
LNNGQLNGKSFCGNAALTERQKRLILFIKNCAVHITASSEICCIYGLLDNIEIGISNTNNGLECQFTDLKSKHRNHNGLSK